MPTDFLSLFTLLNTSGARYVLVGGLAVLMHGVDLAPEAAAAVVGALTGSGYRPMAPVDPGQSANRMQVFSLWDSTNQRPKVDILLQSPVGFEALWQEAELVRFRGVDIRVASIPHLILFKLAAGRPQDIADVDRLRTILRKQS